MGDEDDRIEHAADDPTAAPIAAQAGVPAPVRGTPSPSGLSWAVTVALAVAIGAIVYFVVRLFR